MHGITMSKLILSFNGDFIKEFKLDKETLTIGRKQANDIHIDNLAVSGNHAKIFTILNESFIEDLDSTNGTFVAGNKISKHALQNGENIIIGTHELKYVNDGTDSEEVDFEQTMVIHPDADTSNNGPRPAKLQLMSGANSGKELQLTKILTTLGRPEVQVAAITRRPKGYFLIVVDAGNSDKIPLVNGEEINKQHPLSDGDLIQVAGIDMRFSLI
jgi:pSer/pThr/pTyr-binding forkhead associated (FHA) protein